MDINEFNTRAMQILLHAGEAKEIIKRAVDKMLKENCSEAQCEEIMQAASKELLLAHKEQTSVIQETVTCENLTIPLLFIHAQDTLMTTKSEFQLTQSIITLYFKKIYKEEAHE